MGRGAAATPATKRTHSYLQLPSLSSFPSLPALPTRRKSRKDQRSPLLHDPSGVAVGAAIRIGLLHHLRGAPSQDRNAVLAPVQHGTAMLSVFAGHGKHGARLAEMAATVMSRHVRHCIVPRVGVNDGMFGGDRSSSGSMTSGSLSLQDSTSSCELFVPSMERIVDDAFVEANIAIDDTPWSRNNGTTATICLLKKGKLVVGNCGNGCIMVGMKKGGRMQLKCLSDSDNMEDDMERERVERYGGVMIDGCSVSEQDEKYVLPYTRSLGYMEMRSMGVCQVPTIRTFELTGKETHLIVSSQPLWSGEELAPQRLADCIPTEKGACVIDVAERLMKVAFGDSGPMYDATVLCARLR